MTKSFRRWVRVCLMAAPMALAGSLVSTVPAHAAAPAAWDTCAQIDNGRSLCMFNRNPPESWPDGWAAAIPGNGCRNANEGFMPHNNTTSYAVNHSNIMFYIWDGLNCTGALLIVYRGQYGGMPSGWNDRLSSVSTPSLETIAPAGAVTLQNGGFLG
jgi:uncharacterized membrane protein